MVKRPNLLFVFTDEQAAKTMKTYGNGLIQTPNMDKLAQDSLVFRNTYVTQPVCTPSRSTIMTGLYPHTNGCTENNKSLEPGISCFPELGDFRGYNTAYYGKWHLGDEVFAQHGFGDWKSIDDGYRKYYSDNRDRMVHSTYFDFLIDKGYEPDVVDQDGFKYFSRQFCTRLPEEHTKPAYVAKETCRFIRENKNNPFILYVNFFEPHMPYHSPRDDQYDPKNIPLPENFYHELSEANPLKTRLFKRYYYEYGRSGLPLKTEEDWCKIIANYWGLISLVDTYLGRILDTLNECGLADDTIVAYTSDHGDMVGSHKLLAKCVMFQEAVGVPLMLRIPWLNHGKRIINNPVSQVDIVPTLLEAMEQPIPEHLQGHSWMRFLKEDGSLIEENVFIEWNGLNTGTGDILGGINIPDLWREIADEKTIIAAVGDPVRTIITPDGWKYNCSTIGEDELYNLYDDPFEMENLAGKPEYDHLIGKLRIKIREWQERTGDIPRVNM